MAASKALFVTGKAEPDVSLSLYGNENPQNVNSFDLSNLVDPMKGSLVWSGADFENQDANIVSIGPEDEKEIHDALEKFNTLGLDGDEVSKQNFALPNLGPRLEHATKDIHSGCGFFTVKGIDMSSMTAEDSVTLYLGIASYVGDQRGLQDRKGNMLSHVTDSKLWTTPVHQRHRIHSSLALPFHNDMGCDIMALQVRDCASNGGSTYLSSSWTVFNDLLVSEPEVVKTLLTPNWPVQISGRKSRHYFAKAFAIHDGRLMTSLDPSRFGPQPGRSDNKTPVLTFQQEYALRRVSEVARQNELRLELQIGDLLFFNNWALFHRRDAYTDNDQTSRHIVRLWLRNSDLGWKIPLEMQPPWLAAFGQKETKKIKDRFYPLIPMPEYEVPKYSAGSAAFVLEESDDADEE